MNSVDKISNNSSNNRLNLDDLGFSRRKSNFGENGNVKTLDQTKRIKRPDIDKELLKKFKKTRENEEIEDPLRKTYFEQFKQAQEKNEQKIQESKEEAERRKEELQKKVEKLRAFRKAQADEEKKKKKDKEREENIKRAEELKKRLKRRQQRLRL